MKRILLALVSLLLVVGCGKPPMTPETGPVIMSSEFLPYVNRFQAYAAQYGRPVSMNVVVKFDETLGYSGTIGYCQTGTFRPIVAISRAFWNNALAADREELLFHEFGHCILGRGHRNDVLPATDNGIIVSSSIMNAYHIGSHYFQMNYWTYLQELFQGGSYEMFANENPATNYTNYASTYQAASIAPPLNQDEPLVVKCNFEEEYLSNK